MQRELESFVIKRLARRKRKAKLVTIDLDPTVDPTHGQQVFSFLHGHYNQFCFLPLMGFLTIDEDPEQYLFCARRPTHRDALPKLASLAAALDESRPSCWRRRHLARATLNSLDSLFIEATGLY